MTFNDGARLDTSRVQRRRGGTTAMLGGGGVIGVLVLVVASQLFGINLMPLAGLAGEGGVGNDQVVALEHCRTGADANADDECRMAGASGSIDAYWSTQLGNYRSPKVVLYRGATNSGCGSASNSVGPFYCPRDEGIYVDTSFFETLRRDFGARGGPLAQMYVLAHEWGHHVSNLTGSLGGAGTGSGESSGSVRLELQADCFAGAWVQSASTVADAEGVPFLKPVTREEIDDALGAAAAVGDDHIMEQAGQRVNPDAFTHGTSEQRQRWFLTGYERGPSACRTFEVAAGEL